MVTRSLRALPASTSLHLTQVELTSYPQHHHWHIWWQRFGQSVLCCHSRGAPDMNAAQIHSLMSEVGDKMVSCTISDLDAKLDNAHEANENENLFEKVHGILSKMPSGGSNNDEQVDNLGE